MAKRITNAEIPTAARQNIPIAENPPIARNAPPIAQPTNPPMRLLAPILPMAVAPGRPGNVSAESAESHELGFWLYAYHGFGCGAILCHRYLVAYILLLEACLAICIGKSKRYYLLDATLSSRKRRLERNRQKNDPRSASDVQLSSL